MKYDIVTIGGATEDISFYTNDGIVIDNKRDILRQRLFAFEYGAKITIKNTQTTFGGGAANVAVAARHLGLKAACLVAVGNDERGKHIIANLKKQKVDTRFVQKIKNKGSNFSFLLIGEDNEHVVFSYRDAGAELDVTGKILKKVNSEFLYITSLSNNWQQTLKNIFTVKNMPKIMWNPGQVQLTDGVTLVRKYLKKTHVVSLNEDEATELIASDKKIMRNRKENAKFLSNIKNLLTSIKSYGPQIVVITRGRRGADAYDGNRFYHSDIKHETRRVDTTGVGDAFGASFVSGLKIYKGDIKKAMDLGIKNCASVIAEHGAQNGLLNL